MTFEKGFGTMLFVRARRHEERGAILVLSTVGLVLAMIAAGLAIDLGRIAQAARDDQRIADLAALDAARVAPADYPIAAAASAARNGLPSDPGFS
ncbi:MAG TPA: pilus assembly protein TadG-related protein, partial [Acidimicrobiales bacterium]|nr:pilus assembly protein TadG-related protein [Acidimicrobiales bacterium]